MFDLNNLEVYKEGLNLVNRIYSLIRINIRLNKDYSLCDQIKRAAISIPANISEGYFRSNKQTKNYLEIASGSANEMITLLKIVSLVHSIDTLKLQDNYSVLAKRISSFSRSF